MLRRHKANWKGRWLRIENQDAKSFCPHYVLVGLKRLKCAGKKTLQIGVHSKLCKRNLYFCSWLIQLPQLIIITGWYARVISRVYNVLVMLLWIYGKKNIYIYIYIYIYICVCVCVRERERETILEEKKAKIMERKHAGKVKAEFSTSLKIKKNWQW